MSLPLPVILCGGLGTRLGALVNGLPKPMINVAGRPFLEHILRQLAAQGFGEALLLVGYRAELIQEHFGNGGSLGLAIRYSEESEPQGTGGALRIAKPLITRRFLMLYGDLYRPAAYASLASECAGNVLGVYPYAQGITSIACANVGLDLSGRRVSAYAKDRPDLALNFVDAGFGFFKPAALDLLPEGVSSFEASVYPALAARGELGALVVDQGFFDIGNPADLAHARACMGRVVER